MTSQGLRLSGTRGGTSRFTNIVRASMTFGLGAFVAGCGENASDLYVVEHALAAADCATIVLTPPADVTTQTCRASRSIAVGQATATGCGASFAVRGELIASNGVLVSPPVEVVNGALTLVPGRHVIRWTVVGQGNVPPAFQTVVSNPGLQAGDSIIVGDRGRVGIVTSSESGPAGMIALGHGGTTLGHDSLAGTAVSVGAITLLDRSRLLGDATSGLTVTVAPTASVAGTITQFSTTLSLPSLLPALPAFPPPANGNVTVNSNALVNLAPGSYGSLVVNSGGMLVMSTGNYFFQNLNVNSNTTVVVALPPPGSLGTSGSRIFVANQLSLQTQFQSPGGGLALTLTGFAGSSSVALNQNYLGTFVAPNAELTLGTGGPKQFIGAFYAHSLRVGNDTQLLCNPGSAVGGQL